MSYICPKSGKRLCKATRWRIDDPAGYKHALKFAADRSKDSRAMRASAKKEGWIMWVTDYLSERYRKKPKTLTRYLNAWDWLRVYLEEKGIHHPEALDYVAARQYIPWRTQLRRHCGKVITFNTAMTELKIMGVIMGEALRRGYCGTNPCLRMGLKREDPAEKPEMTDEEIALIRQLVAEKESELKLPDRWMTTSFEIAIHHGCRLSETSMAMSAVDLVRQTLRFNAKGGKVFTVRIHPGLLPHIQALKKAGATHTCRLPQMASKEWHTLLKGRDELTHLCFHCTRVTVITRLARAGVPIQQAMAYVGHSSQAVHRIYQRLKADDLSLCTQALAFGMPAQGQHNAGHSSALAGGTGEKPQSQDGERAIR